MTKYMTENDFQNLSAHFDAAVWIIDQRFWKSQTALYFSNHIPAENCLIVPGAEESKCWKWLEYCLEWLCEKKWPASKPIVGLGGGATLDLVALVAHLYKRGTPFISIPTTTLAMIDASLGSKCGINCLGIKNMIGAMHEPLEHYLIPALLGPDLEASWVKEGMSEAYKHGLISSCELQENVVQFLKSPNSSLLHLILDQAASIKLKIVELEKTQPGIRHLLNLGHTTAHAFEAAALEKNRALSHGSAVAIGLVIEAYLMQGKGTAFKIAHDLKVLLPNLKELDELWPKALMYMKHDKKGDGSKIAVTCFGKEGQMTHGCHSLDENAQKIAENERWIKNIDVDTLRDCWKSFCHDFSSDMPLLI